MHSRSPKGLVEIHNHRLFECITLGRLYKLRLMLEDEDNGVDVNCFDENQMTPLMVACALDDEKKKTREHIIRILLKRGADPNIIDNEGMTVLANACKENKMQITKALLNRASLDINFNIQDRFGDTALMHAVRTGNAELVRLLVNVMQRFSIDIDVKNNSDITPYLEAKRFGFDEIAHVLSRDGHASQSLKICPLIFDEYSEDAYYKDSAVHDSGLSSIIKAGPRKLHSRARRTNRSMQVKSAQETRSYSEGSRWWANEVAENGLGGEATRQEKRERSKSEPKPNEKELLRNNKNLQEYVSDEKKSEQLKVRKSPVLSDNKNEMKMRDDTDIVEEAKPERTSEPTQMVTIASSANDVESNIPERVDNRPTTSLGHGQSQPEIAVVAIEPEVSADEGQEQLDNLNGKTKNAWLRRLQKRAPTWKRKLQSNEAGSGVDIRDENRGERNSLEMKRESTLSGGALRRLLIEKPNTPVAPRRCSSNLSVYLSSTKFHMPRSRPGSAYNIQEKYEDLVCNSRRQSVVQEPVKPRITYEEVFELCPEMKDDSRRKWYSDLRWMLALKAHQNSSTYLPAQPERYHQEPTDSDFRFDSEGSRTGGRMSVFDMKRPTLKKRNTTLSPTTFKEFREVK